MLQNVKKMEMFKCKKYVKRISYTELLSLSCPHIIVNIIIHLSYIKHVGKTINRFNVKGFLNINIYQTIYN